jgi:hypothetical protein
VNDSPPKEADYDERLASRLQDLLKLGPRHSRILIAEALGAYPTDVLASLRSLQRIGKAKEVAPDIWSSIDAQIPDVGFPQALDEFTACGEELDFPEPHPLDFDWRFSKRALEEIEKRLDPSTSKTIAVLGAPTVFKYLRNRGRPAFLFDRNAQIIAHLKREGYNEVTQCDLFRFSLNDQFDCVVADPPWYLDHYQAFIEAARRMLMPDGKLLISVLPPLTRPSAESDRSAIVGFAQERGFDLFCVDRAVLGYLSPPFEVASLKSDGIVMPVWRSGDLYTFVLARREQLDREVKSPDEEQGWQTFTIGRTVVKVKSDDIPSEMQFDFDNVSEMNDFRLRSVSRRSPSRAAINLWTSRNLALNLTRPDIACAVLQLLARGYSDGDAVTKLRETNQLSLSEFNKLRDLLALLIIESKT